MASDVIMPQMGESIAEGTITKWLKKVGDSVQRDEPIFEISTDKVDAEIPSPVAGTLLEIKVGEGQTVAINTVVARIGEAGEQPAASAAAPPVKAPEPPKAAEQPKPAPAPPPPPPPARPAEAAATAAPAPPAPTRAAPPPPAPRPPATPPPDSAPPVSATGGTIESFEERVRTRSSPLVRKIAQENAVDIREIEGTGIHNRVTKNDILSFIENRPVRVAAVAASAAPAPRPVPAPEAPRPALPVTDRDEVVAMTKIRKITADNMVLSKRTSAHVTTVFHVDYTNVARLRDKNKEAFFQKNGVKLTYLPFIFRACVQALKEFPQVNASIDGDNIVYHKDVHLGMAVALDWGLIVPVIRNADEKSILGLARVIAGSGRARADKEAEAGGDPGRHLHGDESGRLRLALRNADHSAAAGRDPGRRDDREAAGGRRPTRTATTRSESARSDISLSPSITV